MYKVPELMGIQGPQFARREQEELNSIARDAYG
jgi:hypothetical protein